MNLEEFTARVNVVKERLYRTAYLYLGSEVLAVDAVDEAVFKGLKALKQLRQPEYFETWLTRILINECKKELRRRKKEQPFEYTPETVAEQLDYLPLKEAIRCLPMELREVVILRYFGGLTLAETAEGLDIPQGTVVTRQRRALGLLRLELSEEE